MSTNTTLSPERPAAVDRARRARRRRLAIALIASVVVLVLVAVFVPRLLASTPPPLPSAHGNRTPTGVSLPTEPVLSDVSITGIRSGRDPNDDDSPALITGGLVIVADDADETRFSAVSLETGESAWQAVLADGLAAEYPGDTPHWFEFLTSLNAVSGEERWRVEFDRQVSTDVLWTPSEVVLTPARFFVLGTRAFLGTDGAYRQLVAEETR